MTRREKLAELISHVQYLGGLEYKVADHLLDNGVIVLPIKVGDVIWDKKVEPWEVISVEWFSRKVTHLHCVSPVTGLRNNFSIGKRSIGKTVFLSREEAEAALKERECG